MGLGAGELALIIVLIAGWFAPAVALWRLARATDRNPHGYLVLAVLGWLGLAIVVLGMVVVLQERPKRR